MADSLLITELIADCRLGGSEEERAQPQRVWIDLELAIDAAKAAARDDVHATVDYARLVSEVKALVEAKSYHLLETMAEELASFILKEFDIPEVRVRVKKRALPGVDAAAVELIRVAG